MEDWLGVLKRARGSLDNVLSEQSKSTASESSQDRIQRLFNSIIGFAKQNKGHKWLSNFEVAAMHLSVHMKVFLPPCMLLNSTNIYPFRAIGISPTLHCKKSSPRGRCHLVKPVTCLLTPLSSQFLQIQGSSQTRLSCLRNPLDVALALSPIALLQDKLIWSKSAGRGFILEVSHPCYALYSGID
jgi:hypothetical protein